MSYGANTPPAITTQPANKSVTLGATATFSVVASGTAPLTYQWSKNSSPISGATSATYTTPTTVAMDSGSSFTVQVTNSYGNATSNAATLTVNLPPTISTQPSNQTVLLGATATFSVVSSGTGTLSYQWSKSGSTISGATSASYTTPATTAAYNGATFTVKVTNSYGNVTSSAATLTVNSPAAITTQPANQSVTLGGAATFTVVASGTAPLTYQWSKNSSAISGATSASYTTPVTAATDSGSAFSVLVTNPYGNVTSSLVTLTVNLPPTISTQPVSQTVLQGATATFSVVASGTGTLTYQWFKSGSSISGATSASYTTPATTAAYNGVTYTVKVTNTYGNITSNAATLTVNMPPTITTQPASTAVPLGSTATFSVVAAGTAPFTYQWSKSGSAISGATSASYTTPATLTTDNASTYKVVITNAYGNITSSSATLTVDIPAGITTQPVNKTVTLGATATFSVTASGTALLTYQWSKNGTAISGATSSSYTTPATVATDTGATFFVQVTNAFGTITSTTATLTLNLPPSITTQPISQTVNIGSTAMFSVVATGSGTLTYQWSKNGTAISRATSPSYTTPATAVADNGASFTVKVTNSYGNVTTSAAIVTVVVPLPIQPVISAPSLVTANQDGYIASVPAQAASNYSWGINGGQITGGSSPSQITFMPIDTNFLAMARVYHTSTLLSDGRVLITGGVVATSGGDAYTSSAEVYDPTTATSTILPTMMTIGRFAHTATLLPSGQVLLTGGLVGNLGNTAETFDPSSGAFTATPGLMTTTRYFHTATLLPSGKVLISGGDNEYGVTLSSAEIFDPTTGIFSAVMESMTTARVGPTATLLPNGTVLIAGGADKNGASIGDAEVFSPTTGLFTATESPMVQARQYHTATLLNSGEVLLAGGAGAGGVLASAERFDQSTGSFVLTASTMLSAREQHTATLLPNGQTLLAGGDNAAYGDFWATGETYDLLTDSFTPTTNSMGYTRSSQTANLMLNGQVLLAGGTDCLGNSLASIDLYNSTTAAFITNTPLTLSCTVTSATGIQSTPGTLQIAVIPPLAQPAITAPAIIWAQVGYAASVIGQPGCSYAWTITNGTITGGGGTAAVTFTGGTAWTPLTLTCTVTNSAGSFLTATATAPVIPGFVTISPAQVNLAPGGQQVFTANQPLQYWGANWLPGSPGYGSSVGSVVPSPDGTSATFTAARSGVNLGVGSYLIGGTAIADTTLNGTAQITVFTAGSPLINSFTANPEAIHAGQSTTLSWNVSNATSLILSPGPNNLASVDVTGQTSVTVSPNIIGLVYSLQASNGLGIVSANLTVPIDQVPTANLIGSVPQVPAGGKVVLTPTFTNGVGQINPGGVIVQSGVAVSLQPLSTTNYILTVTNPYGVSASSSVLVNLVGPGAFLPAIPLLQTLNYASALRLYDGSILLSGGTGTWLDDAVLLPCMILPSGAGGFQELNSLLNPWFFNNSTLAEAKCSTSTLCSNGNILIYGNTTVPVDSSFTHFTVLNPGTGGVVYLTIPPNINAYRYGSCLTLLADGRILLTGGDCLNLSPSIIVDINADSNSQIQYMGTPSTARQGHVAVRLMDGRVLVAGGMYIDPTTNARTLLTSAELYDPITGVWSPAGSLFNNADAINPILLPNGQVVFNGVEKFDPITNAFIQLPIPYPGFTGFGEKAIQLQDGRILMGNFSPEPLFYDPTTGFCSTISNATNWNLESDVCMTQLSDGTILSGSMIPEVDMYLVMISPPMIYQMQHFDPQSTLYVHPAVGHTNVGMPLLMTATGPDAQGVTWSATGGSITTNGILTSSKTGLVAVTATAPDGIKAMVWVDVHPAVSVSIAPAPQQLSGYSFPNGSLCYHSGVPWSFQATVNNHPNTAVIWSLQEGAVAGTITSSGIYTGSTPGNYHIVATSVADSNKSAIFLVTVFPPVDLTITPANVTMEPGDTMTFTSAEPTGDSWATWSSNGVIQSYGGSCLYSAPATPGTYTLIALSRSDPSKSATATITVVPITSFYISPSRYVLPTGLGVQVHAYAQTALGLRDISNEVTWNATGGSVAQVSTTSGPAWYYTAPSSQGTYVIQAGISGTTTSAQATMMVVPPATFNTAGLMVVTRLGHTMTRLLDGRVLIAGGSDWNLGPASASAEIYDPATQMFTTISSAMTTPRVNHSATLLPDGTVLLVGGTTLANAELFNPATQTFSATALPPLYQRSYHFAILLPDARVLIAGGNDGFVGKSMEIYDPLLGGFIPAGDLKTPNNATQGASTLLADGRVLFAGASAAFVGNVGYYGLPAASQANAEAFDFRTGLSTLLGCMNVPHNAFSLTQAANGIVWAIGQTTQSQQPNSMASAECFDLSQNKFTIGPLQPNAGGNASVELVDGSIWSMGPSWYSNGGGGYVTEESGMRFFPSRGVFETALFPPVDHNNFDVKAALLPTGAVLWTGTPCAYCSRTTNAPANAGLLVFDTASAMTVLPAQITLVAGRTWPFQASATGLGDGGFTWSADVGTVTAQGAYTAPSAPGTYHVTAVSNTDGVTQTTAIVTVIQDTELSIIPSLVQLAPGANQTFTVDMISTGDLTIAWTTSGGTIGTGGAYTAPSGVGTYTVTATSVANPALSATATVVVTANGGSGTLPAPRISAFYSNTPIVEIGQPANLTWNVTAAYRLTLYVNGVAQDATGLSGIAVYPTSATTYYLSASNPSGTVTSQTVTVNVTNIPVSISITPTTTTIYAGTSQQFGYTLNAPTNRLLWSATGGSITQAGLYTAPSSPGTTAVTVISVDDPSKTATATVTVQDILLSLNPLTVTLDPGQSMQFGYSCAGTTSTTLVWSCTGGTIQQTGLYVAPSASGTYIVSVYSTAEPSLVRSATVTVGPPLVEVTPGLSIVSPGGTQQFQAIVRSGSVTWSVLQAGGGTIDQYGNYTAPQTPGNYTVQALSTVDNTSTGTAVVAVSIGGGGTGGGATGGSGTNSGMGSTGVQITLSPATAWTTSGVYFPFQATISGTTNTAVTWSITGNPTVASVDSQGVFLAKAQGNYQVQAQSVADPTAVLTASISVASNLSLTKPPMGTSHFSGYSVTALQNGTVLIAGGLQLPQSGAQQGLDGTYNYTPGGQAWIFDPSTGQYTATGSMVTPRSQHQAVLLNDGRVLIMGGYAQWHDPWSPYVQTPPIMGQGYIIWDDQFPAAEVYDPASGTFKALPVGTLVSPSSYANGVPFTPSFVAFPGQMFSTHPNGTAIALPDGRVLAVGGDGSGFWGSFIDYLAGYQIGPEPFDLFTPGADVFDLDGNAAWRKGGLGFSDVSSDGSDSIGFGQAPRCVVLANGQILFTAGADNDMGWGFAYSIYENGPITDLPAVSSAVAEVLNPATLTTLSTGPMQLPRFAHTLTVLPDGRVLAVGGKDMTTARSSSGSAGSAWNWNTTATAEIYDPSINAWTPTMNLATNMQTYLNFDRAYHAAQLLPNGQVLIVGGYHADLDGNVTWPNTTEIYDPTTGVFSVMDTLDYGISSPQLVMMNNGQVFVAGQYEPPMTPPTSQTQTMASKLRPMDAGIPATITAGSDLFGTITTPNPLVKITQIQCDSGVLVSYNYGQTTVAGPNWATGVAVQDGLGSSRPAVYLVNGNANGKAGFSVRIAIAGVIPGSADGQTATLTGTLQESSGSSYASGAFQGNPLTFTGQFPMTATNGGDIPVQMTIDSLPNDLRWFRGDVQWTVTLANSHVYPLPIATRMEIFTILDSLSGSATPPNVFAANGAWPEVLRVIFGSANLCGISVQSQSNLVNAEQSALANITSYIHWNTNLLYGGPANYLDLLNGGNNYGGPFKLKNLLVDLSNNKIKPRALCFDLAGAIQVFGESIGIRPWWECSNAYGYIPGADTNGSVIPSTHLIGIGLTNNPDQSSTPGSPNLIYNWNQNGREYFTGHGFIKFNGLIFDATVGPHLGTENLNQYLQASIDGLAQDGSQDVSSHHYFLYVYYLPGNGAWQVQHASWTQYYQGLNTNPGQVAEDNVGITEVE